MRRSLANFKCFSCGSEQRVTFSAHVRGIHAAVLRHDFRQLHQFVGIGVHARRSDQARRHAKVAGLHCGADQLTHVRHLRCRGRALGHAHRRNAHRGVTDQEHDVVAQSIGLQASDVLVRRTPVPAQIANVAAEKPVQLHHGRGAGIAERSRTEAAVPVDFGRHALQELAVAGWPDQEGQIGVGVHIDEPGAHDATTNVDARGSISRRQVTKGNDAATGDPNVGSIGARARPVDHQATGEHQLHTHSGRATV